MLAAEFKFGQGGQMQVDYTARTTFPEDLQQVRALDRSGACTAPSYPRVFSEKVI